jgi:hypothetical protein
MALTISSCGNKAVTISSTAAGDGGNYRSCLKRPCDQPTAQAPCKSTRFTADQVKLIEQLCAHDLWDIKGAPADRVLADKKRVPNDCFAKDYVNAHGMAYAQFAACCRSNVTPSVSGVVQNRLVFGVRMGHRSLENSHGDQAVRERQERARAQVRFIVNAYQQQGVHDETLRKLSKELSSLARRWSRFIGRIDAVAAHDSETTLRENVEESIPGYNQGEEAKQLRYITRDMIKRAVRNSYHEHEHRSSQARKALAALSSIVDGHP